MKISLQWLKEFVEIDLSPQELAQRLTHAGLEVEEFSYLGKIPESVQVAQLQKIEKHPQADRLTVCEVSLGKEARSIVCGAKNMKVGDKVPLAFSGTLLPDGKKIEKSKIRGIASEGMLCSEVELGLFEDSTGLFILPSHLKQGLPLASQMSLEDVIFEINVTPNRADCLSVYGIAREIAAILSKPLQEIRPVLPLGKFSCEGKIKVEVKDAERCPRYTARMLRGVQVAPSPFEIRLRLHRMGFRSINNVVDATNYVMMELGQPLHAFDAEKIQGGKIIIRRAEAGEKLKTLDEVERSLATQDLLITDSKQILAIAGVMGGRSSGVGSETHELILESAYFQAHSIRKTSKHLGLQTESSYRFERGVDPDGILRASDRLAELILKWAGGELSLEQTDTAPQAFPPKKIQLRLSRIHQLLGVRWESKEISERLHSLGFKPQWNPSGIWDCTIPSYRHDLNREVDLIEEVARLVGYEKIPPQLPLTSLAVAHDYYDSPLEENFRSLLSHLGFMEVIHYSFASEKEFGKSGISTETLLHLANPLSEDLAVMRSSLIPAMLSCLQRNMAHQAEDLKLYELRSVYQLLPGKNLQEAKSLCLALSGKAYGKEWNLPVREVDFFDLKGVIEKLITNYGLPAYELKLSSSPYFHPGASAEIFIQGKKIGEIGQIHPQLLEAFDLRVPVVLAELKINELLSFSIPFKAFQEISPFPWVDRDLTLIASESMEAQKVIDEICRMQISLIREVNCVDVYHGEPIESGKKALTYSIIYLDEKKTLTDVEVNEVHQKVLEHLKKALPIEWR